MEVINVMEVRRTWSEAPGATSVARLPVNFIVRYFLKSRSIRNAMFCTSRFLEDMCGL